jgi:hypothetical protein
VTHIAIGEKQARDIVAFQSLALFGGHQLLSTFICCIQRDMVSNSRKRRKPKFLRAREIRDCPYSNPLAWILKPMEQNSYGRVCGIFLKKLKKLTLPFGKAKYDKF